MPREPLKFFRIGLCVRPHGVHGAIKLKPLSDFIERFEGLKSAYVERGGRYEPVKLCTLSAQADAVIVKLEGVDTMDAAQQYRGAFLCVPREEAVTLPEGTYFVEDLIGCEVFSSDGDALGELTDVLETGANDVYVINGAKKLLVPALKKLLNQVDIANKRITLDAGVLKEVALFED